MALWIIKTEREDRLAILKNFVKETMQRLAPKATEALLAKRHRKHVHQMEQSLGLPQITDEFIARYGLQVLAGPFIGMTYIKEALRVPAVPKLLGCYEEELAPLIEAMPGRGYSVVVDVGCAEGYYAVGLARLMPGVHVHGFDTDVRERELCTEMAQVNGVSDRVTISGHCNVQLMASLLSDHSLVVCDCEGYEYDLLRPDLAPRLASADVLVEVHDVLNPIIPKAITERFSSTHDIQWVTSVERDPTHYPFLSFLSPEQQSLAVSEFRQPAQPWAFLTPKH